MIIAAISPLRLRHCHFRRRRHADIDVATPIQRQTQLPRCLSMIRYADYCHADYCSPFIAFAEAATPPRRYAMPPRRRLMLPPLLIFR